MDDNFLLTQRLVDIPHRKFVFVSTLAVYPPTSRAVSEDEDVDLMPLTGPYAFTKLFSDLYVQERASNPLILRTTTLLGPAIRPSTVLWPRLSPIASSSWLRTPATILCSTTTLWTSSFGPWTPAYRGRSISAPRAWWSCPTSSISSAFPCPTATSITTSDRWTSAGRARCIPLSRARPGKRSIGTLSRWGQPILGTAGFGGPEAWLAMRRAWRPLVCPADGDQLTRRTPGLRGRSSCGREAGCTRIRRRPNKPHGGHQDPKARRDRAFQPERERVTAQVRRAVQAIPSPRRRNSAESRSVSLSSKALSRVLFFYEIYKKIINTHGIIVEFGVRWGQTLSILSALRGIFDRSTGIARSSDSTHSPASKA